MKKVLLYLFLFLLFQIIGGMVVNLVLVLLYGGVTEEHMLLSLVGASALSSVLTIAVFIKMKYVVLGREYIDTHPWTLLALTFILALAMLIPSAFCQELLPESMTKDVLKDVFSQLLDSPIGYIIIGICAPLTEELVFRGAVLREMLHGFAADNAPKRVWFCIAFSALFFSLSHLNPAQIPHAFLIGLLLGWLYYRTGSILPGLLYHWVNNSSAYVLNLIFPEQPYDAKLIDYFQGDQSAVYVALALSSVIAIASLLLVKKVLDKDKILAN